MSFSFDIQSNYNQSHNIVNGFKGDNELAFDKTSGQFVVLEGDAEKAYGHEHYETSPSQLNQLILAYLKVNPAFVDSPRIISSLKERADPSSFTKRFKRLGRGEDIYKSEVLLRIADNVQAYYDLKVRKGEALSQAGTEALLHDRPRKSAEEMTFRMKCEQVVTGVTPRSKLIVDDNGDLLRVNKLDPRSSPVDAVIAAFKTLLEENMQHEEVLRELHRNLSRSPTPLAEKLLSATPVPEKDPSPPGFVGPPLGSASRQLFEHFALDRQVSEIGNGFSTGKSVVYNTEHQNFIAITGSAPAAENVISDESQVQERIKLFIQTAPLENLDALKALLKLNDNAQSKELIQYLDGVYFERSKSVVLVRPLPQQLSLIPQGFEDGQSLFYNKKTNRLQLLDKSVRSIETRDDEEITDEKVTYLVDRASKGELTQLRKLLISNNNTRSKRLIRYIESRLFELAPGTKIETDFLEFQAEISKGLTPGYCLIYDEQRDCYIALQETDLFHVEDMHHIDTDPGTVLSILSGRLETILVDTPEAAELKKIVDAKLRDL